MRIASAASSDHTLLRCHLKTRALARVFIGADNDNDNDNDNDDDDDDDDDVSAISKQHPAICGNPRAAGGDVVGCGFGGFRMLSERWESRMRALPPVALRWHGSRCRSAVCR